MKGLLYIFIAVIVIIGAGVGLSFLTYESYVDGVASASTNGYEEGYTQGYEDGLIEGGESGYQGGSRAYYAMLEGTDTDNASISNIYFLYNPSFNEVMDFLDEEELYSFFDIHDYTVTHGIRSGYVRCYISMTYPRRDEVVYDLVAFDTVDEGLVVIEPWSHRAVVTVEGEDYRGLFDDAEPETKGTVSKVTILW